MRYFAWKLELVSGILWMIVAQKLHKQMIKKFKRMKVFARFKGDIWAADVAEMGSLPSKFKVSFVICGRYFH